jgi:hypothetical protein
MPPNSDYAPVLDLNAARHRFTEKSATGVIALLNLPVPVLEMLEPAHRRRPVNPLYKGASAFERVENTRLAAYARDFLLDADPQPSGISTRLQKDLEVVRFQLMGCRNPRDQDVWLHALLNVAQTLNPYLPAAEADLVWNRIARTPCFTGLHDFQKQWIGIFRAVGQRNAVRMAELGGVLLANQSQINNESREYLWMAALTGYVAAGANAEAKKVWDFYAEALADASGRPAFRLLRCRAEPSDCADAFQ